MDSTKEYRIPLQGIDPNNLKALSDLITRNSSLFENFALSSISDDDIRYTYDGFLFEVTDIDEGGFNFVAPYSYYEGCVNNNFSSSTEGYAEYEIVDGVLVFALEELDWDVR